MKIIFVGHSGMQYPHTRVRCYGFAKVLKERGFDTEVFSFKDHLAEHLHEEDMYAHLRDRDKMKLVLRGAWQLLLKRADLLYVQKVHFHTAAPYLLSRAFRKPYILDYDDYDVPLSNFFHKGRWNRLLFGSHKWEVITERVARHAVGCVASSHWLEDYLKPMHPRVIRVETGVDTHDFHPPRDREVGTSIPSASPNETKVSTPQNQDSRPLTFLWNGIVWGDEIYRCVIMAMQAFERVNQEFPNSRLMVIGGGFQWQKLIDFTKANFNHVPIIFHGWFPPSAMPCILREADIGILPFALDNDWVRSKSPTKLFEYMASGLAVVATNLGEVNHVIQHGINGMLANDVDEMSAAMRRLTLNPDLRKTISQNARQTMEQKYSMEVLGDRLAGFLREVI